MFRPIIFLTQTYLDLSKIDKLIATSFVENPKQISSFWQHKNIQEWLLDDLLWKEFDSQMEQNWQKYQANSEVIMAKVYLKSLKTNKDLKPVFDEELGKFYVKRHQPCLLLLGDLEKYDHSLQDAMLKLLEEPPQNLQIVLYKHNQNNLIPTIQSRCLLVNLPDQVVYKNLDPKVTEKVMKFFPKASDFAKALLNNKSAENELNYPFHKDMEREEIDCWLWQVLICLEQLYKQSTDYQTSLRISKKIEVVLQAKNFNQQKVLKKFALASLQL